MPPSQHPFLTQKRARSIAREFGTAVFVYDRKTLERQARLVLGFPNAFGLTARYAMKACHVRGAASHRVDPRGGPETRPGGIPGCGTLL